MLCVLLANIHYPKIIGDKGEADGSGVMFPETGGCLALTISMLFEAFFETLSEYIAIGGGLVVEIIMLDDLFWHVSNAKAHVFVSGHWGIEIKILS